MSSWWKKEISKDGTGLDCPRPSSNCEIKLFEEKECFEITVGRPKDLMFVSIDECVQTMKVGETCLININYDQCPYLSKDQTLSNDELPKSFKVELLTFSPVSELWQLNALKRLEIAACLKEEGVNQFKLKQKSLAFYYFSQSLKYLISIDNNFPNDEFDEERFRHLKLLCYLNASACQLSNGSYKKVIQNCNKVLELDNKNVKGLYRRGTAFTYIQEFENAECDLKLALNLDPNNEALRKQLKVLINAIKRHNEQYATSMKKMFDP